MNKRKSPVRRTLSGSTPGDGAGPRSRRRRTPPLGTNLGHAPPPAQTDAPAWVNRARILVGSLEEAIADGSKNPAVGARVEMAFAAWELFGTKPDSVARVAHLVERAYEAIRGTPRSLDDQAVRGCAHILYTGLPMSVRATVNFPKIVSLVQALQKEPEAWTAIVKTTAEILGWSGIAITHAGQAIRVAMASQVNAR
jgi:hypothetical protein